jgi:hypothetical protein
MSWGCYPLTEHLRCEWRVRRMRGFVFSSIYT